MTNFAGRWFTTFGTMDLEQHGDQVQGRYAYQTREGTIEGHVEDGRFVFHYAEPGEQGEGWFALQGAGRFAGRYCPESQDHEYDWRGSRGWDGVWESSFGRLRLVQEDGGRVRGCYEGAGPSTIEGTIDDAGCLAFRYREPNVGGEGVFELAEDGQSFSGHWHPDGTDGWAPWLGQRVRAHPGLTWVVVIEAHWQRSLADPEYSYGGMVREFFARVAGIAVRHRMFNDEQSLARWCRELAYLAEPAVVMIASHGTPEGPTVNGHSIDTRLVIDSLRDAADLKLLHFSSCLVLHEGQAGDFARRIAKSAPFPISGYTTSVDWGGSALLEFAYLDMILSKGLAPSEAADLLPRVLSFAGDVDPAGSPYGAAGFRYFAAAPE